MKHLSQTRINMILRCPRQFKYRYIDGLIRPPTAALVLGGSYHKALEGNYRQKVETRKDLSIPDVQDLFDHSFTQKIKSEVDWRDTSPGKVKDQGYSMLEKYMEELAPKIQPSFVEHVFETNLPGIDIPFVGVVDLIENTKKDILIDHKTASRSWNPDKAHKDLQATAYWYWYQKQFGKAPANFRFDIAVKNKKPVVQSIETTRDKNELDWWIGLVQKVYAQIQSGIFPPNPTGWWCSKKWCGYFDKCRESRNHG